MDYTHMRLNQCENLYIHHTGALFSIHFIIEYLFNWFMIVLQVVKFKRNDQTRQMPKSKDKKGSLSLCVCVWM